MIVETSAIAHACRSLRIDPRRAFPSPSAQRERADREWHKVTDETTPTAEEWAEVARLIQKHTGLKVTPPAFLRGDRQRKWLADLERINLELQSATLDPGHKSPAKPRGKS